MLFSGEEERLLKRSVVESSVYPHSAPEGAVEKPNANGVASHSNVVHMSFTQGSSRDGKSINRQVGRVWIYLLALFSAVVLLSCFRARAKSSDELAATTVRHTFDYIVVGGGPSGIIAATELANRFPGLRVLLLESGTVSQSSVLRALGIDEGPTAFGSHLNKFDVPLMWSGVASSQERRKILQMKQSWSNHHWPVEKTLLARGLGGCGLHNAMIYVRSLPSDFDRWNSSLWKFEHILPHYKALEWYNDRKVPKPVFWQGRNCTSARSWRGKDGEMRTLPSGMAVDPIAPQFIRSALNTGEALAVQGFNSPETMDRIGVGYYEFNIHNGVRDSVARALLGTRSRIAQNLVIKTGVTVRKVITKTFRDRPRAIGVTTLDSSGKSTSYWLSDMLSEVVLAAGAVMTPQLLYNSGIGSDGSVVDLPGVGKNLQDHPAVAMKYALDPSLTENTSSIYTVGDELEDYLLSASGLENNASESDEDPLLDRLGTFGTAGFSAGGFFRSPYAKSAAPDIQLTVFPRQIEPHVTGRLSRGDEAFMRSRLMLVTVALIEADARYSVIPSSSAVNNDNIQQSSSHRQRMTNNSALENPLASLLGYELPSIQLPPGQSSYLSQRGVKAIAWGVERVRRILSAVPISSSVKGEVVPGRHVLGKGLQDYIVNEATPNSHWVGSTKLGLAHDKYAVVSERLAVHGIDALRIVDSGVIPLAPNGNTHSTVCVVARRGAQLIAEDRNLKRR